MLRHWLSHLDAFNTLAPAVSKDDSDDIWWSNVKYSAAYPSSTSATLAQTDKPEFGSDGSGVNIVRKADLENHNKDGGLWIVIDGKVYDVQDFRSSAPCGADNLGRYADGADASHGFHGTVHSEAARDMMSGFLVGTYFDPSEAAQSPPPPGGDATHFPGIFADAGNYSSPFMDLERNLAYFMGLFNHNLYLGTPPSQEEARCAHWTAAEFVRGGLAVNPGPPDPFEEEKGKFKLSINIGTLLLCQKTVS